MIKAQILKLLKNVSMLIGIVLLCNYIIRTSIVVQNYWGFEELETKRNYFDQNAADYNTLFLGSSRFYRQIDPAVFDASVDTSLQIKSFNYGLHSLFAPLVYDVYEQVLKNEKTQVKFAFLELMNVPQIALVNLRSERTIFWYTWEYYCFAVKAIWHSKRNLVRKIYGIASHTFCYFENLLNFKMLSNIVLLNEKKHNQTMDTETLGKALNGFYSYDEELNTRNKQNFDYVGMKSGYDNFLRDTATVTDYQNYSEVMFARKIDTMPYNATHLKKLHELIAFSESLGVHLIFLLPPRLVIEDFAELLPLYAKLPSTNKIEVSNSKRFPHLYLAKYSFDFGHLNEEGAKLFSEDIAKEFNKRVIGNQPR